MCECVYCLPSLTLGLLWQSYLTPMHILQVSTKSNPMDNIEIKMRLENTEYKKFSIARKRKRSKLIKTPIFDLLIPQQHCSMLETRLLNYMIHKMVKLRLTFIRKYFYRVDQPYKFGPNPQNQDKKAIKSQRKYLQRNPWRRTQRHHEPYAR